MIRSTNPNSYTSDVIKPATTTTYQLSVTGANGCMSDNTAATTITVTPPPQVFAGNDTAGLATQPVALQATDINNSRFSIYQWSPAAGLSNPSIANPVARLAGAGHYAYILTASTPAGCTGNETLHINVFVKADIYVATAFTPNGDNNNDVLHAKPVGIKTFGRFSLYDRWGNLVFYTTNPATGWDGKLHGQPLQAGTLFVWTASGIDYTGRLLQKKGTVLLLK